MPRRSHAIVRYRRRQSRDHGILAAAICALMAMLVIGGILFTYGVERAQVSDASQHLVGPAEPPKKSY